MRDLLDINVEIINNIKKENPNFTEKEVDTKAREMFMDMVKDNYKKFDNDNWEQLLEYAFENETGTYLFEFIVDLSGFAIIPETIYDKAVEHDSYTPIPYLMKFKTIYDNKERRYKLQQILYNNEKELLNEIKLLADDRSDDIYDKRNHIVTIMDQYKAVVQMRQDYFRK